MSQEEPPHLGGRVDAGICRSYPPLRRRLATRPGVTAAMEGIEHHRGSVSAVTMFEARDVRSDCGLERAGRAPVALRPVRHPAADGGEDLLHRVERIAEQAATVRHDGVRIS